MTRNHLLRGGAVCLSVTLFAFLVARAQLGCTARPAPVDASPDGAAVSDTAGPAAPYPAQAAPPGEPAAALTEGPAKEPPAPAFVEGTATPGEPTAAPAASAAAPEDPMWFPASKSGRFIPPPQPSVQRQQANQAPVNP